MGRRARDAIRPLDPSAVVPLSSLPDIALGAGIAPFRMGAGESVCRRSSVREVVADVSLGDHPSERPTRRCRNRSFGGRAAPTPTAWPCMGVASCDGRPLHWCALTAPFHPCLCPANRAIGGLFSAALSARSPPPESPQHPALWSPDLPRPGPGPKAMPGRGHPTDSPAGSCGAAWASAQAGAPSSIRLHAVAAVDR